MSISKERVSRFAMQARWFAVLLAFVGLASGCSEGGDSAMGEQDAHKNSSTGGEQQLEAPNDDFSWIVPGQLAAMPVPGRKRPLPEDAALLEQRGIRVLVSLTEEAPERSVLAARSIDQVHIPVKDFTAPTLEQMSQFVSVVESSAAAGKPVGVHCTAGLGRSGTMAAGYLVSRGVAAAKAMAAVRQIRPGSIETAEQEEAIREFERHLNECR